MLRGMPARRWPRYTILNAAAYKSLREGRLVRVAEIACERYRYWADVRIESCRSQKIAVFVDR